MTDAPRDSYKDSDARHLAAVARSLRWADDAAERRDYHDALGWLQAVEAAGDELPDAYQARRNAWLVARRRVSADSRPFAGMLVCAAMGRGGE